MAKKQPPESHAKSESHPAKPKIVAARRTEDFRTRYANNFRFESTVFDLKILFGQVALMGDEEITEITEQHTAITLPWATIKLLIYWLQVNVLVHEKANGKVTIPPSQIPPPPPEGAQLSDEVSALHQEFMASI